MVHRAGYLELEYMEESCILIQVQHVNCKLAMFKKLSMFGTRFVLIESMSNQVNKTTICPDPSPSFESR